MGDFSNMVGDGFKEARRDFGVDFTVTGVSGTFRGVQHSTADLLALGSGGFTQDYLGGLEYLSTEVTILNGGKVTISGTTYRVEHASGSTEDPVRMVFLIGKEK